MSSDTTGNPTVVGYTKDALKSRIRDALRASIVINPVVELREPGSLPVFEGKAKRVVDARAGL